jgi:hypothetical protein
LILQVKSCRTQYGHVNVQAEFEQASPVMSGILSGSEERRIRLDRSS